MVNISLNALLSAALLFVSLGAVTAAPAPHWIYSDGEKPPGSTICGPVNMCQAEGGGNKGGNRVCAVIPKGCCFKAPAKGSIPGPKACQPDVTYTQIPPEEGPKGSKDSNGPNGSKNPKGSKDSNGPNDPKDPKDSNGPNGSKDPNYPKDPKDSKDPKGPNKSKDPNYPKDSKDSKDSKGPNGSKGPNDPKDPNGSKGSNGPNGKANTR